MNDYLKLNNDLSICVDQININLIEWREPVREEVIRDTTSGKHAAKIIFCDSKLDKEVTRTVTGTSEAIKNLGELRSDSHNQLDKFLSKLLLDAINQVENMKIVLCKLTKIP